MKTAVLSAHSTHRLAGEIDKWLSDNPRAEIVSVSHPNGEPLRVFALIVYKESK